MKRAYIFDLDGTLFDTTHRQHLIDGTVTPKDWPAFFEACHLDPPIPHMINLAYAVCNDVDIVFLTGRSADVRQKTLDALNKAFGSAHGTPADWIKNEDLYMRASGDHRADTIVKSELLDQVIADGLTPVMCFEDRSSVVSMWRERGIPCCQVAPGDF
jgi:phosphoglycolate phosphatase-like HAD superfamily hydrolase